MKTAVATTLAVLFCCRDSSVALPHRKPGPNDLEKASSRILHQLPTDITHPANVRLGGGRLRFVGSRVSPFPAKKGSKITVSHFFEVAGVIPQDMKMFVHVEDSRSGGMLMNLDHDPIEGLYPMSQWKAGDIVEDRYTIDLPSTAPDAVMINIGFYRYSERLSVDDVAFTDGQNRIRAIGLVFDGSGADEVPTYRAPRRNAAIVIDGKLDDPGWVGVPGTGRFVRTMDGGPTKYRTEAKLVWDDEFLYVGFDGDDEDVWFNLQKNDAPIYQEEVYEIFIDADGDGATYNELEISPGNFIFDAYFPARRQGMDLSWDSQMKHAVSVRGTVNNPSDVDQGWSAELQIPVSRLASVPRWPPMAGDRWRFNLYRLEWHSGRKVNEGSAFSPPLIGDFHNLARFAKLEFVK
jgi:hypothetical protein